MAVLDLTNRPAQMVTIPSSIVMFEQHNDEIRCVCDEGITQTTSLHLHGPIQSKTTDVSLPMWIHIIIVPLLVC
jgi:hypothetical protein